LGALAEESLLNSPRNIIGLKVEGQESVFTEEETNRAHEFKTGQEKDFVLFLMSILSRVFKTRVIVNSENFAWLPVSQEHRKLDLKPDLLLLHAAFYRIHRGTSSGRDASDTKRCGSPADESLFPFTIVFEAKIPDNKNKLPTNGNFGEAIKYGVYMRRDKLGRDVFGQARARVLLVTPSEFWLIEIGMNEQVLSRTIWKWDLPGSLPALQTFCSTDDLGLDKICALANVQIADPYIFKSIDSAYLGTGGTGRAFAVLQSQTGQDPSKLRKKDLHALKVVKVENLAYLQFELAILKDHSDTCKCDAIVAPTSEIILSETHAAFTMQPVGRAVTIQDLIDNPTLVKDAFEALRRLHTHNPPIYHSDPRLPNLLIFERKLVWIDLRQSEFLNWTRTSKFHFTVDVNILMKSILSREELTGSLLTLAQGYDASEEASNQIGQAVSQELQRRLV
jgi:tRNA A-37 threonylcarbamoyl transferase component Bud32